MSVLIIIYLLAPKQLEHYDATMQNDVEGQRDDICAVYINSLMEAYDTTRFDLIPPFRDWCKLYYLYNGRDPTYRQSERFFKRLMFSGKY
jgi:hypothetical protein